MERVPSINMNKSRRDRKYCLIQNGKQTGSITRNINKVKLKTGNKKTCFPFIRNKSTEQILRTQTTIEEMVANYIKWSK